MDVPLRSFHLHGARPMVNERRNYGRRAQTMQRVLEAIRTSGEGIAVEAARVDAAVGRILRRLAVRGLVRIENGFWRPAPILTRQVS